MQLSKVFAHGLRNKRRSLSNAGGLRSSDMSGMTLLEIMIVLAILAVVMGAIVAPRLFEQWQRANRDAAQLGVDKLANESFAEWRLDHPSEKCPSDLEHLAKYAKKKALKDPWGNDYIIHCGDISGPNDFGISSAGKDGKSGTEDDLRSWE
jgi:general secretion pathway protein G